MTMAPTTTEERSDWLAERIDVDTAITRVESSAVALLNRSEVESQLDAAHRYPRSVKKFLGEALTLATLSREVAESCIYALPRGGKTIAGPSVRLAEIVASAYGNLHVAARVLDAEDKEIVAQGVAWDLEKNLRVTVETRRRITKKNGQRFDDDMITMAGAAAGSIALRNAIFRVVPRAYVDTLYAKIREVAVGNASTLAARRADVVGRLQKIGVPIERIFARIGKAAIEDVGLDELETLIGLGTAIKSGGQSIDQAFPPPDAAQGKAAALNAALAGAVPQTPPGEPSAQGAAAPTPAVAVPAEPAPTTTKGKGGKVKPGDALPTGDLLPGVAPPKMAGPEKDPLTGEIVPPMREPGDDTDDELG